MIHWESFVDRDGLVEVVVDHPLGSESSERPSFLYELNCGFVRDTSGEKKQQVYIAGVCDPVLAFRGVVVAVIHRKNGRGGPLVVAPEGMHFSKQQIKEQICFRERFFDSEIELI